MDRALLAERLAEQGEPAYRLDQVWRWTARGVAGYEAMTNVPAALRAELEREVPFSTLAAEREAEARDGTVKTLFRTRDGHPVEAVLMRYRDGRRSLCLSSQSGCPLTCTFCATGQMQFGRNLTTSEILDQALHFRRIEAVDHAVFMGMGEPMLNLDAVVDAARALPDLGITHRRTTISTVGWLPGLRRFVDDVEQPIRLALSLHAPSDELRSELMPVNERYPLADVLAECRLEDLGRSDEIGVEDQDELAGGRLEPVVEGARLETAPVVAVEVVDVESQRAVPFDGGLGDGAGLVGGVVEDLDLEQLLRVSDPGHGVDQAVHDVHLVVEGKLDGHPGKTRGQRGGPRPSVLVAEVQVDHDVTVQSEDREDHQGQEVEAKDRRFEWTHDLVWSASSGVTTAKMTPSAASPGRTPRRPLL